MKKKRRFVHRFMEITGKTSAIFGPANRSALNGPEGHAKISSEAKEASSTASQTWEVKTTSAGEHYVIEIPKEDSVSGETPL